MNEDVDTKKKRRTSPSRVYNINLLQTRVLIYSRIHILLRYATRVFKTITIHYTIISCDDDETERMKGSLMVYDIVYY